MRMTTVIAVLRSLVNSLWPFAKTTVSPTKHSTLHPTSEPVPATPGNGVFNSNQPHVGDTPPDVSDEQDEPSGDKPECGLPDNGSRPLVSITTSAETPIDPTLPECKIPASSADTDDQDLPTSSGVKPDDSPTNDDGQHAFSETINDSLSDDSDNKFKGNIGVNNSLTSKSEPRKYGGRRGRQPKIQVTDREQSPSSRPELVCRRIPESACFEVLLTAGKEFQLATAYLNGEPLIISNGQCRIPSLDGCLTVTSQDGEEHSVQLFEGKPLIFKLPNNWNGEGRKISGITNGHFIFIVPKSWQRTGRAPVEAEGCVDLAFQAHYFYRDATASDESVYGFREWNDSSTTSIELTGRCIFDDSDESELFIGNPPDLKSSANIVWARVGEEYANGWGMNFQPNQQPLSEILTGREGRFFLRIYDTNTRMLDSIEFRYLPKFFQIYVNGAEYTQDTVLVPSSKGYSLTMVRFVDADGTTLSPVLPIGAHQQVLPSGAIKVPPNPNADRMMCSLGPDARCVNIVLDLPRIWWRLEDGRTDPEAWSDTPLIMTRKEFRMHAHSGTAISLMSKRQVSVRVGFGDELDLCYHRKIKDDCIVVPLVHFVDHQQIDLRLNVDTCLNVEWAQEIVPLIVISADPMPEINLFTAEPATIIAGEETVLEWTTRNACDTSITMIPDTGVLEIEGSCIVRPAETTIYKLVLAIYGANDISRTVSVTVVPVLTPGKLPTPRVLSNTIGWRTGKGFSSGELESAGLTVKEAEDRSIPIDRRRRTSHRTNVETIRSMLDA